MAGELGRSDLDLSRCCMRARWRDAPDCIADVIRDKQRTLLVDRDADRTAQRIAIVVDEPGQDVLRLYGGATVGERDEYDLVAAERIAIPGAVLADERAAFE